MKEIMNTKDASLKFFEDANLPYVSIATDGSADFNKIAERLIEIVNEEGSNVVCFDIGFFADNTSKYVEKTFIPALKKSKCTRVAFIVSENALEDKNNYYPLDLFCLDFRIEKYSTIELAIEKIKSDVKTQLSDEILNMTKEDALKYLGVPADSTIFVIDDKFWQLSKRYRSMNSPEGDAKLEELSAVYDIATGERDKRNKNQEIRDSQKKFLGKTSDEWKTYFSYTWYKYLIGAVLLVVLGNLFYTMVLKPRYDVSVVALGHMSCETEILENILIGDCSYTNPYVNCVDVVPDNDEGQTDNGYGDQTAATVLMSNPDVLIADMQCVYFYYQNFYDCSDLYEQLRSMLPEETFSKLSPVYYSERDYQMLLYQYEQSQNMNEVELIEEDFEQYDPTPVMIGIRVNDEAFSTELGFENLWHTKPGYLVFGIGSSTDDVISAQNIIIQILKRL